MSAPATQSVYIQHNNTATLVVTVAASTLGASGLSGYINIWFTAKWSLTDPDANAAIQKTLGSGVVITTPGSNTVNGVVTITLSAADTAALPISPSNQTLNFDVQGKDPSGNDYTFCKGFLIVQPHATLTT
jgi:hypothetical protein